MRLREKTRMREDGETVKKEWTNSIVVRYMWSFLIILLSTLAAFVFVYHQAYDTAQKITYEKLSSQAENYLQSFNNELKHVRRLQNEFFTDRKLVFIIAPDMNINEYEKRDCLLSVRERIDGITGVSRLVSDGVLYLPKSGYRIRPASVHLMTQEDREQMNTYLTYADDEIHFDGKQFFIVKTGAPVIQSGSVPNHVFVLTVSREEVLRELSAVCTSPESGAFWFSEEDGVWAEYSRGEPAGEKLALQLHRNEQGEYENVQRLEADGNHYLVFAGGSGELGLFVQYELETAAMQPVLRFRNLAFIVLGCLTLLGIIISVSSIVALHKPINTLLSGFRRVQSGNWKEHIEDSRKDEFGHLYRGFNEMEDRMDRLINEVYVQTNLTQQAQMKQLQAQIAPHFLYNSFFVLSRRIKRQDYENAELLAKHLGNYFQYLTRNGADYVPLRLETDHAKSYSAVQDARFSRRIHVQFEDVPEAFGGIMLPRLVLQPLLENAFKYGLEEKVQDGLLRVSFVETDDEWQIRVEDNGENIPDEKLQEITDAITQGKKGEVTALANIHRRLQIYYHGQSGVRVQRSPLGGLAALIWIGKEAAVYEHEAADR